MGARNPRCAPWGVRGEVIQMAGRWVAPLDPECPEVVAYHAQTDDDPIMEMSGCAGEFYADFERQHRAECTRCQEYGAANVDVAY